MGCSPPSKRPNEISKINLEHSQMKGNKENFGVKTGKVKKYV